MAKLGISDDSAGLNALLELLAHHGDDPEELIAMAIETPRGLLVAGRKAYAINPLAAARYRDSQQDQGVAPGVVTRFGCLGGGYADGDGGQEGQRERGEHDVPVPCCPVLHLVVVQVDLSLGGLEALFDAPAGAGHADEFGQGCCGG